MLQHIFPASNVPKMSNLSTSGVQQLLNTPVSGGVQQLLNTPVSGVQQARGGTQMVNNCQQYIPRTGGTQHISTQFIPQVAGQHGDIFIGQNVWDETFNECQ